jgi:hypothetical protein
MANYILTSEYNKELWLKIFRLLAMGKIRTTKEYEKDRVILEAFRKEVDVIWNMQPTPAGLNNYKRAKHPVEFFKSPEGHPFFASYDFLPSLDSVEFADATSFIAYRRKLMIQFMKQQYDIDIRENPE